MKQIIRVIFWTTNLLMIAMLIFMTTTAYSISQFEIGFAEPNAAVSNETMTIAIPFHFRYNGIYDISDLNLTTLVNSDQGIAFSNSSTYVPNILKGAEVSLTHKICFNFSELLSKSSSNILFNDCSLNIDVSAGIGFARIIPVVVSSNFSTPWGAPLHGFTIGKIETEEQNSTMPMHFENHSLFALVGTIELELYDSLNQLVGRGSTAINVKPQGFCDTKIAVTMLGVSNSLAAASLNFDTSVFNYGPVVFNIAS